jgi:glutaredoxin 3
MENAVGLAVANRPQHDRLGLQRPRHGCRRTAGVEATLFEAMREITVYTTDHCSLCTSAKTLLERRGIQYVEINLARDPDGRAQLQQKTGMFSFPQIMIEGETIGGFAELLAADREGRLSELLAA